MSDAIPAKHLIRRGTEAQWISANPVLQDGEMGYETDTKIFRIGDGVTAFMQLVRYANYDDVVAAKDAAEAAAATLQFASTEQAEEGEDTTRTMNPALTKAAILALTPAPARATVAEIHSLSGEGRFMTTQRVRESAALITPSGASNWAPNWSGFNAANWVLTGNRTLNNPINVIPGTTRVIRVAGDSSVERTISFGSNFVGDTFEGPVTNASFVLYTLFAATETEIWVSPMVSS